MTLYLTRAVLDREACAAALVPLLDPPDPDRALDAHHRLIWTLFPGRNAVGLLDVRGILSVKEPDTFLATLGTGLGRARAFGCGLMLIRRV